MTEQLYTTADVKRVRELLEKEQEGKDAATGLAIPPKQAVLDHNHNSQYVRGVLHRQTNAMLGKLENNFTRLIKWWYPGTMQDFLRSLANYVDSGDDHRFLHPAWLKKAHTQFNKLPESFKDRVLVNLGLSTGKNATERKSIFGKYLLSREAVYEHVLETIKKEANEVFD